MSRPDRYTYSQDLRVIEKTKIFSIVNGKYGTHTKVTMYRNLCFGKTTNSNYYICRGSRKVGKFY